jgi:hypothetical protein
MDSSNTNKTSLVEGRTGTFTEKQYEQANKKAPCGLPATAQIPPKSRWPTFLRSPVLRHYAKIVWLHSFLFAVLFMQ